MRAAGSIFVLTFVACAVCRSPASASSTEDVLAKWRMAMAGVTSLECTLEMHARNRGAYGKLLQDFTSRRHLWCDKMRHRIRDRRDEGPDDVWDGMQRRWTRRQDSRVVREELPSSVASVEELWPDPAYAVFPGLLIDPFTWEVSSEKPRSISLVGLVRGVSREELGQARVEVDIDLMRNVPVEVRTFGRGGDLEERVRFKQYRKVGGFWLPELIKMRRNRQRNVEDWDIRYTIIAVNRPDSTVWGTP